VRRLRLNPTLGIIMKASWLLGFALLPSAALLTGCQSARIEKKADAYRRSGAAPSLLEAQRMAENYYWPESAQIQESQRRAEAAARAAKP
jgi:hypothetical protein